MNPFQQYLDLGWKICKIEPGTKGPKTPGWNARENALTNLDGVLGAGLLHAYSGTCAIDIDDWEKSESYLQEHGIDLTMLFIDPNAVTISSGTQGRGKLLYKLPTPLPTIKVADGKLEFRCATKEGTSVQDVLAPSIHPSGRKYVMKGDPANMPELPAALLRIWQGNLRDVAPVTPAASKTGQTSLAELERLLKAQDPNMGYDDWYKIGAILHHETEGSEEGLALWDRWSAPSEKYAGFSDLESHWRSYGKTDRPLTADSLRHMEVAETSDFDTVSPTEVSDFMKGPVEANPFIGQFLERSEWGNLPQPTWIIEDKFPEVGVGSIWGPSGSGKSFLAIDLSIKVATGKPWRGMPVKQGTVLYIAPEDSFGVRRRLEVAMDAQGIDGAHVKVLSLSPKIHVKKQVLQITEAAKQYGKISMIIVDTLAAGTPGMDENSAKEVGLMLDIVRHMAEELQTLVILIHHTGKDASRGARGSVALHGAFDTEWEVEKDGMLHSMNQYKVRNAPATDDEGNEFKYPFMLVKACNAALGKNHKSCSVEWI